MADLVKKKVSWLSWLDMWFKPTDRKSTQYRDQTVAPMMSVDPKMKSQQLAGSMATIPMQSTNLGQSFWYIQRNEPDNINYKISDTDDKLTQLRQNQFNPAPAFVQWVAQAPTQEPVPQRTISDLYSDFKKWMPVASFDKVYPELQGKIPKTVLNSLKIDIEKWMPEEKIMEVYPEFADLKTAQFWIWWPFATKNSIAEAGKVVQSKWFQDSWKASKDKTNPYTPDWQLAQAAKFAAQDQNDKTLWDAFMAYMQWADDETVASVYKAKPEELAMVKSLSIDVMNWMPRGKVIELYKDKSPQSFLYGKIVNWDTVWWWDISNFLNKNYFSPAKAKALWLDEDKSFIKPAELVTREADNFDAWQYFLWRQRIAADYFWENPDWAWTFTSRAIAFWLNLLPTVRDFPKFIIDLLTIPWQTLKWIAFSAFQWLDTISENIQKDWLYWVKTSIDQLADTIVENPMLVLGWEFAKVTKWLNKAAIKAWWDIWGKWTEFVIKQWLDAFWTFDENWVFKPSWIMWKAFQAAAEKYTMYKVLQELKRQWKTPTAENFKQAADDLNNKAQADLEAAKAAEVDNVASSQEAWVWVDSTWVPVVRPETVRTPEMTTLIDQWFANTIVGIKNANQMNAFKDSAVEWVAGLLDNKDNLPYLFDENWAITTTDTTHVNASQAIYDTKKDIWDIVSSYIWAEAAKWTTIDSTPVVDAIQKWLAEVRLEDWTTIVWAESTANMLDKILKQFVDENWAPKSLWVDEAQKISQIYNKLGKAVYGWTASDLLTAIAVEWLNRIIRPLIDEAVQTLPDLPSIKQFKKTYWALTRIEAPITKRWQVISRQPPAGWLFDWLTDLYGWAEIAWAVVDVATLNIGNAISKLMRAWATKLISKYIKNLNDKNRMLWELFKQVDKQRNWFKIQWWYKAIKRPSAKAWPKVEPKGEPPVTPTPKAEVKPEVKVEPKVEEKATPVEKPVVKKAEPKVEKPTTEGKLVKEWEVKSAWLQPKEKKWLPAPKEEVKGEVKSWETWHKPPKEWYTVVYHNTKSENIANILENWLDSKWWAETNPWWTWASVKPTWWYWGNTVAIQIPTEEFNRLKVNDNQLMIPWDMLSKDSILWVDKLVEVWDWGWIKESEWIARIEDLLNNDRATPEQLKEAYPWIYKVWEEAKWMKTKQEIKKTEETISLENEAIKYDTAEDFLYSTVLKGKNIANWFDRYELARVWDKYIHDWALQIFEDKNSIDLTNIAITEKNTWLWTEIVKRLKAYADAKWKILNIDKSSNDTYRKSFTFLEWDTVNFRYEPKRWFKPFERKTSWFDYKAVKSMEWKIVELPRYWDRKWKVYQVWVNQDRTIWTLHLREVWLTPTASVKYWWDYKVVEWLEPKKVEPLKPKTVKEPMKPKAEINYNMDNFYNDKWISKLQQWLYRKSLLKTEFEWWLTVKEIIDNNLDGARMDKNSYQWKEWYEMTYPETNAEILAIRPWSVQKLVTDKYAKTYFDYMKEKQVDTKPAEVTDTAVELPAKVEEALTLEQQVQKNLDLKQKNNVISVDLWERVRWSRKEKAQYDMLSMESLKKVEWESAAMAYDLVSKDRVIGKYDPAADRASWTDSGVVFLKKKLFDSITKKPDDNAFAREEYVKMLPQLAKLINEVKTLSDLQNLADKAKTLYSFSGKDRVEIEWVEWDVAKIAGSRFIKLLSKGNESSAQTWLDAFKLNRLTEADRPALVEKMLWVYKANLRTYQSELKDLSDPKLGSELAIKYKAKQVEYWRGYLVKDRTDAEILDILKEQTQRSIARTEATIKEREEKYIWNVRDNNWAWMEEKQPWWLQKKTQKPTIHTYTKIDNVERIGGRVIDKTILDNPRKIMDEYWYKSVQFWNYMKDRDSLYHVENFIESMVDMWDTLWIDLKRLNKDMWLSIAFWARGTPWAAAHYEPLYDIINLTKSAWDWSVAHEWWHFFDNSLGKKSWIKLDKGRAYLTEDKWRGWEWVYWEIKNLANEMMSKIQNEWSSEITKTYEVPKWLWKSYPSIKRIFEKEWLEAAIQYAKWYTHGIANRENNYFGYIARLAEKPITVTSKWPWMKFYNDAKSLWGYWSRPVELWARAWEAYIQDKMMAQGKKNNYLVANNVWEMTMFDMMGEPQKYSVYPQWAERELINTYFDKIIDKFKWEYWIGTDNSKPTTPTEVKWWWLKGRTMNAVKWWMSATQWLPPEVAKALEKAKWLWPDDIMKQYPDIQLKRDIPVTDVYGNKLTIPEWEVLTPYVLKDNKILLQDWFTYIVSKSTFENQVKNNSIKWDAVEFAPELKGTEEKILGRSLPEYQDFVKQLEKKYWKKPWELDFNTISRPEDAELNRLLEKQNKLPLEKYSQYTLPWWENYKEILIKAPLPKKVIPNLEWKQIWETHWKVEWPTKDYTISKRWEKEYSVTYWKKWDWTSPDKEAISRWVWTAKTLDGAKKIVIENIEIGIKEPDTFQSSHYDDKNLLAHLRLNERKFNSDKNNVTFMEEWQSDWAREARKNPPKTAEQIQSLKDYEDFTKQIRKKYPIDEVVYPRWMTDKLLIERYWTPEEMQRLDRLWMAADFTKETPSHPLLAQWQEMTAKRALQEAVKNWSEYISWINWEQTAARYNLSKQVDKIWWKADDMWMWKVMKDVEIFVKWWTQTRIAFTVNNEWKIIIADNKTEWVGKQIDEVIGKWIAEKIMKESDWKLEWEWLNIWWEWAYNLYDKQYTALFEKLTGKKAEKIDLWLPTEKTKHQFDIAPTREEIAQHPNTLIPIKSLEAKDLKVWLKISWKWEYFHVTQVLGNWKFKAVDEESLSSTMRETLWLKDDWSNFSEIRSKLSDYYFEQSEKTFDLWWQWTALQNAIKLTPDVVAKIKWESPITKKPSWLLPNWLKPNK